MSLKVGLPRALFYHTYYPLWQAFYAALGVETVVSPETNKGILNKGIKCVVEETCLPVKVFFGHVAELCEAGADYLFVPRLVSVEKKAYICPKFMGLPDMLKASRIQQPPLIAPVINFVKVTPLQKILDECAAPFTRNRVKINRAWQKAWQEQKQHEENLRKITPHHDLTILLLGHDYNVYDRYINMDLIKKLQQLGCQVMTAAHIAREERDRQIEKFPRSVFWTYGRNLIGAAYHFMEQPGLKGVIILSSFGCGIDSFIDNFIIRRLTEQKIPHLNVVLDEHTGEGGLNTRLEAFVDIIRWRRDYHQGYVSPHGQYLGSAERNA